MRVSVTELDVWQECAQRWAWQRNLRPRAVAGGPLLQGRAFHAAVEEALMLGGADPDTRRERAFTVATRVLMDVGEEQLRWRPGVESALRALPEWLWEVGRPVSEDKLEVEYIMLPTGGVPLLGGDEERERVTTAGFSTLTMVGKPDLWYFEDGALYVVELKSTGKSGQAAQDRLESYRWWGLQPQMYAVLLTDKYEWLRGTPVFVYHLLASTRGKAHDYKDAAHLLTEDKIDSIRLHMLTVAGQLGTHDTPAYGPRCAWCDYRALCLGVLTGADTEAIMEEQFARRAQ